MKPTVEPLETRTLLSSGTAAPIVITGTAGNDSISLSQAGNVLTVVKNGVTKTYPLSWTVGATPTTGTPYYVPYVQIDGGAGNDTIVANDTVKKALTIRGGAGNDLVRGGALGDTLYGGSGLTSGPAEDGKDTVEGGAGNDIVQASYNNSCHLAGGDGNDLLTGFNGADTVGGGAGNDTITGNNGNDWLVGDLGNDVITGNDGNNTLLGGDGNDLLTGGLGADSLSGG